MLEHFIFCPLCGGRLVVVDNTPVCERCGYHFYQHPAITASVIIYRKPHILLAKRKIDPHKGKWDIPGGFLNFMEHPVDAAKREVFEETGLIVENLRYHSMDLRWYTHIYPPRSILSIVFWTDTFSGVLRESDEAGDFQWFDTIPSVGFKVDKFALKKFLGR